VFSISLTIYSSLKHSDGEAGWIQLREVIERLKLYGFTFRLVPRLSPVSWNPEVKVMPRVTLDLSLEEIKSLILKLPSEDLLAVADAIEERRETMVMMQLAETGFSEWNEEGEDLHDA